MVLLRQLREVIKRPWLFPELFMNKSEDFWVNHSAKKWFKENAKNKRIFEYGSGYSTDFLADICEDIISVENNLEWFNKSSKIKKKNKKVFFRSNKKSYINEISKHGKFDIVFVDADYRGDCAKKAWGCLKKGGVLVLDDVNLATHAKLIFDGFLEPKFKLGGLKSNTGGYWETGFVFKK